MTMDRKSVKKLMGELGESSLKTTRKFLKKGGVIESGYKGEAGNGLQQMLVEFGCDLTIDGAIGSKTMDALHQVQERFGIEPTDQVDLEAFDTLVPLLMMAKGIESSEVDLKAFYDAAGGEGYYEYLKGCALAGVGKYYSAMEAFLNSHYEDSQERARDCVQEMPDSGELWRNPDLPGTDTRLSFTVYGAEENSGMCFRLLDLEDNLVSVVFVRGASSGSTQIPAGTYHVMDGTGNEWYGINEGFGPSGHYEYLTFSDDEETRFDTSLDAGNYELSINVSELSEGATSVGASSVGWDEAW